MFPMIKTTSRYRNPRSSDSVTEPAAAPRAAQEEPRSAPVNVERVVIVSAPVIAELHAELYLYKSWQARDRIYTIIAAHEKKGHYVHLPGVCCWVTRGKLFLDTDGYRSFTVH